MKLSIDTDSSIPIGFVEVFEHSGAFLLIEIGGVCARESLIQHLFDGQFHLCGGGREEREDRDWRDEG
jgi:hypothetical protein